MEINHISCSSYFARSREKRSVCCVCHFIDLNVLAVASSSGGSHSTAAAQSPLLVHLCNQAKHSHTFFVFIAHYINIYHNWNLLRQLTIQPQEPYKMGVALLLIYNFSYPSTNNMIYPFRKPNSIVSDCGKAGAHCQGHGVASRLRSRNPRWSACRRR